MVRVHAGYGRDTRTDVYRDRRREVWDDRGGPATLRNYRGRFVDTVSRGYNRTTGERTGTTAAGSGTDLPSGC
jgi:hypothetical protein